MHVTSLINESVVPYTIAYSTECMYTHTHDWTDLFDGPPQTASLIAMPGSPRNGLHAGCPVEEGQKWSANYWVWNKPRSFEISMPDADADDEYSGRLVKEFARSCFAKKIMFYDFLFQLRMTHGSVQYY